jgi:flagellar hook-associated protein 1 FlgK
LNSEKIGQGVTVDRIEQIRDEFLDTRYRTANSENSALSKTADILSSMDNIFDETINDGLGEIFEEFYTRLQTLSANTGKVEFAELVRSSAQKTTETLKYYYKQLNTIRDQEQYDLSVSIKNVNKYIDKINDLNESIQSETLQGNPTNDLLDTRNLYLDKLSSQLNITTQSNKDGTISIKCGSKYLIDAQSAYKATLSLDETSGSLKVVADSGQLEISSGMIMGFLEVLEGKGDFGGGDESDFYGIPYYQRALDNFSSKFAETFNSLNGTGKPLFIGDTALTIEISDGWLADAN